MKLKKISMSGVAIFVSLALGSVTHAAFISGTIDFVGPVTLDTSSLGTASQVVDFPNTVVSNASGDFDVYVTSLAESTSPSTAKITTPWSFSSGSVAPFWQCGGFTFDLTSSAVVTRMEVLPGLWYLDVIGTGVAKGNGFDDTNGIWAFNMTNKDGDTPKFSFQSTTDVPDGGTTLALLGLSLLGLHGVRRRLGKA